MLAAAGVGRDSRCDEGPTPRGDGHPGPARVAGRDPRRDARSPSVLERDDDPPPRRRQGLVPGEHGGDRHRRGRITKTGNALARRLVVEAAWHYRHRPRGRRPAPTAGRGGVPGREVLRRRRTRPARVRLRIRRETPRPGAPAGKAAVRLRAPGTPLADRDGLGVLRLALDPKRDRAVIGLFDRLREYDAFSDQFH